MYAFVASVLHLVCFKLTDCQAAAERAASSSRQLLKALNELRRVDSILEGCCLAILVALGCPYPLRLNMA